jgi:hypothetical protein
MIIEVDCECKFFIFIPVNRDSFLSESLCFISAVVKGEAVRINVLWLPRLPNRENDQSGDCGQVTFGHRLNLSMFELTRNDSNSALDLYSWTGELVSLWRRHAW